MSDFSSHNHPDDQPIRGLASAEAAGLNGHRIKQAGRGPQSPDGARDGTPDVRPAIVAAGYGGSVLDDGEGQGHLLDYVKVLYKRRWTATTAFLVVFLGVVIYTFTATPIYEAKVQILIEKENANVVNFKEAFEQNQIADDYYQTQYKILQSRALARKTIDALKLWEHPQFNPAQRSWSVGGIVGAPVALVSGWFAEEVPTEAAETDEAAETLVQSAAIDRFLRNLTVSPIRNSRLVDVRFEGPTRRCPRRSPTRWPRRTSRRTSSSSFVVEGGVRLARRSARRTAPPGGSERAGAAAVSRENRLGISLKIAQNVVVQKLADLNGAVTKAKTERIQKEAMYNQIRSLQSDRTALDTFPAILTNTFIQRQKGDLADLQRQQAQLSDKLGSSHPDMLKIGLAIQTAEGNIQGEIAKVVQSMRNEYRVVAGAGAEPGGRARAAEAGRAGAEPQRHRLRRPAARRREQPADLREPDAAHEGNRHLRRAQDEQYPRRRCGGSAPRTGQPEHVRRTCCSRSSAAPLFAFVLAFFFEYLDNRIKTPDEIKAHLGLAVPRHGAGAVRRRTTAIR